MITGNTGTDWEGEYSGWAYDESKGYYMVAKEYREPGTSNGIPLLDRELNENTEIIINLLRRAVQHIQGNGAYDSGFKITESGNTPNNNFTITGGDSTAAGAGYIFVDGWMPICLSNKEYTNQTFGPTTLTTPTDGDRVDEIYIDVYYKEYSPTDDPDMKDTSINLETSRRIGLVWEVRVSEGGVTPANYVDGNNIQHFCHGLAVIYRLEGNAQITTEMLVDIRNIENKLKKDYVHVQSSASDTWTVEHFLDTANLIVQVFDDDGAGIEGEIDYTDSNELVITFGGASIAGKALIYGISA